MAMGSLPRKHLELSAPAVLFLLFWESKEGAIGKI